LAVDCRLLLERADNERTIAIILAQLTENTRIQSETFQLARDYTFYSAVISHSYYCIFYCAKAYLLRHNIVTEAPDEHAKTLDAFRQLVNDGHLDRDLLCVYETIATRADTLLHIFERERKKRGGYTYHKISQANKEPADESVNGAKAFYLALKSVIEELG
jgi:uncharacterized protein (UPF0332 family)